MEHSNLLMFLENFGDAVKVLSAEIDTSLFISAEKQASDERFWGCPRM